jgi:hypothetical protein
MQLTVITDFRRPSLVFFFNYIILFFGKVQDSQFIKIYHTFHSG